MDEKKSKMYMIVTLPIILGLIPALWFGWIPWPLVLVAMALIYLLAPSDLKH